MAEIGQAATEVYAPTKTLQVWRTLLNWLTFFFQIFVQIIRGTPSVASLINYSSSSSSASFKPLPVVEFPESSERTTLVAASLQIPPSVAGYDCLEKLTVVLDLDETLVCAYETSSLPDTIRKLATDAGLTWFELECISSDKEFEGKPKVNYVTVFERPGLHEFLAQISIFAELVLFTAGLEGYAKPLVDRIDAENRFSRRFYRPSTTSTAKIGAVFYKPKRALKGLFFHFQYMKGRRHATSAFWKDVPHGNIEAQSVHLQDLLTIKEHSLKHSYFEGANFFYREYREHVKDLSFVSTNFCRMVIVDNNPFSFLLQPVNGIPCIPFSAGQPRDDQLLEVLLPLLKQLSEQRDVRPILYERFRMPEWFEKHGIPASAWATNW